MMSWKLFALGSALFAGLTAVLAKVGVEKIPSNLATFVRTLVIIGFLAGLITWRKEWQNPCHLPSRSLIFLILSGLATGFSWICYYRALQLGPVSSVAPIDKLSLLVAILLAAVLLHEHVRLVQWMGALLMVVGAWLISIK